MTYDDIRSQFLGLLNRRDCTTAQRDAFITAGIQRIQRKLRVPSMETTNMYTIPSTYPSDGGVIIPSNMIELINLIPQGQGEVRRLEKADLTRALQFANLGSSSGLNVGPPELYARQNGVWVLGPAPAVGDTVRIDYYAELPALVNGSDTNWLTLIAPDMIYYSALGLAANYFNDKREDKWNMWYQSILDDLNIQGQQDEENGLSGVAPCYDYPNDKGDIYWGDFF